MSKFYNDYYSKIKDIYIELPNYSFFHSPAKKSGIDMGFIGRKEIKSKLKNLLTRDKSKSGCYLITGYRGMGKSSVVNETIRELRMSHSNNVLKYFIRIFLISLFFLLISFLCFGSNSLKINTYSFLIISILPVSIFIYTDFDRNSIKKSNRNRIFQLIVNLFIFKDNDISAIKFRKVTQLFFLSFFNIFIISFYNTKVKTVNYDAIKIIISSFVITYAFYTISYIIHKFIDRARTVQRTKRHEGIILKLIKGASYIFLPKEHINNSRKQFVTINLSHMKPQEIDILRQISFRLEDMFNTFVKQNPFLKIWKSFIFITILLISLALFKLPYINKTLSLLIVKCQIAKYFPSQNPTLTEDPIKYSNFYTRINEDLKSTKSLYFFDLRTTIKDSISSPYNYDKATSITKALLYVDTSLNLFLINTLKTLNLPIIVFFRFDFILFLLINLILCDFLYFIFKRGKYEHREIRKELKKFNDRIHAQTSQSKDSGFSFRNIFSFNARKTKAYPIADVREIENGISKVIDKINKIRGIVKPEFIFIFDELDKIDPYTDYESTSTAKSNKHYYTNTQYDRKQVIIMILQNLKFFLTNTEAKFIIIAGRELFEASLADSTDINSFVNSTANEIIYVDSFLTDKSFKSNSNISFMTEYYICKFIIPMWFISKRNRNEQDEPEFSLRLYNTYIKETFYNNDIIDISSKNRKQFFNNFPSSKLYFIQKNKALIFKYSVKVTIDKLKYIMSNELHSPESALDYLKENSNFSEVLLNKRKREKVLSTVQNLITYIAYRSNGAPKKISIIFEKFITRVDNLSLSNFNDALIIGRNKKSLYLKFNYYSQYRLNFTNYLVNPAFLLINSTIKDYGDNLLIAVSFIIDHIYKFHSTCYSNEILELIPEMINMKNTPYIKDVVNKIVTFLSETQLKKIVNGFHDFRFRQFIVEEITLLSKISETEAAAFNFTLGELHSLKKHYYDLLEIQEKKYQSKTSGKYTYVNSIGLIHNIIGDLHFNTMEFSEALVQYSEAIEPINNIDASELNLNLIVSKITFLLKIGFTYEKMNSYESAIEYYNRASVVVIKFRNIYLKQFGLLEVVLKKNTPLTVYDFKSDATYKKFINNNMKLKDINVIVIPKLKESSFGEDILFFREFVYGDVIIDCSTDFLSSLYNDNTTYQKELIEIKISAFENIDILYQPFIAKLHAIEKINFGGLTFNNLKSTFRQFSFLWKSISGNGNELLASGFYTKIGDLLYYKNAHLNEPISPKTKENKNLCQNICSACQNYSKSLTLYNKNPTSIIETNFNSIEYPEMKCSMSIIKTIILSFNRFKNMSNNVHIQEIANLFSKTGNCFLVCKSKPGTSVINPTIRFFRVLSALDKSANDYSNGIRFEEIADTVISFSKSNLSRFTQIDYVFICYYLSAYFHLRNSDYKEYGFQLTKILYIIKEFVSSNTTLIERVKTFNPIDLLNKIIVRNIISAHYKSYQNVHRIEIEKQKHQIIDEQYVALIENDISLQNISLSGEIRESILIFEGINLKLSNYYGNHLPFNDNINPYCSVNTMKTRKLELVLKANKHFTILKNMGLRLLFEVFDLSLLHSGSMNKQELIDIIKASFFSTYSSGSILWRNNYKEQILQIISTHDAFGTADFHSIDILLELAKCMSRNKYFSHTEKYLNKNLKDIYYDNSDFQDFVQHIIVDSIFCLHSVIKSTKINDTSSHLSYTSLAHLHFKLGFWCKYLYTFLNICDKKKYTQTKNLIDNLLEKDSFKFLSPTYHFEQSLHFYNLSIQINNQGKAYHNRIENNYYLNDDYNSETAHFKMALERFRLNSDLIKRRLIELKKLVYKSTINNFDKYNSHNVI